MCYGHQMLIEIEVIRKRTQFKSDGDRDLLGVVLMQDDLPDTTLPIYLDPVGSTAHLLTRFSVGVSYKTVQVSINSLIAQFLDRGRASIRIQNPPGGSMFSTKSWV